MRFLDGATDDTLAIADDEDLDQPGAGDDADGETVPLEPVERSDMPDAGDGEDLLDGETAEAA